MDLDLTEDQEAIEEVFAGFFTKEAPPTVARAGRAARLRPGAVGPPARDRRPGMGVAETAGGGGASLGRPRGGGRGARPGDRTRAAGRAPRRGPAAPRRADVVERRGHRHARAAPGRRRRHVAPRARRRGGRRGRRRRRRRARRGAQRRARRRARATTPRRRSPTARPATASARCSARPPTFAARPRPSGRSLTAGALVGIAAPALDIGVEYVMARHQFGVPIGSFQAVQHGLADLPGLIDGARLLAHKAAWAGDRRRAPASSTSTDNDIDRLRRAGVDGVRVRRRRRGASPPTAACTSTAATASPRSTTSSSTTAGPGAGRSCSAIPAASALRARRPALRPRRRGTAWTSRCRPHVEAYRDDVRRDHRRARHPRGHRPPAPHRHVRQPRAQPGARPRRACIERAVPGLGKGDPIELWVLFNELEKAGAPVRRAWPVAVMIAGVVNARRHRGAEGARSSRRSSPARRWSAWATASPTTAATSPSITTRAVRDGDEWVINGAKMWTTMAHEAEWVILLTRTDPDVPEAQGPDDVHPADGHAGHHASSRCTRWAPSGPTPPSTTTCASATSAVLGEVNGGWRVMSVALVVRARRHGRHQRRRAAAAATSATGPTRPGCIDDPLVRERMARVAIDNQVAKLLTQRSAWIAATGGLPGLEGSMTKVFATEAYQKASRWFQQTAGADGPAAVPRAGRRRRRLDRVRRPPLAGHHDLRRHQRDQPQQHRRAPPRPAQGPPLSRLDGRRILVTGAASGIGRATAIRLASEGATVVCVDRERSGLDEVVDEIGATAATATSSTCSIATRSRRRSASPSPISAGSTACATSPRSWASASTSSRRSRTGIASSV